MSGLPEKTLNQVLVLKDAYEKHQRKADREELEKLWMEAFGKELDGVFP